MVGWERRRVSVHFVEPHAAIDTEESRQCAKPVAVFAFAAVAGLASAQSAPHGPDGYRNNYPHEARGSFWAWQWERWRDGMPSPPPGGWNLPAVKTDAEALRSGETNPSVTWIGHATVLVRLAGSNILFDPVFSERASPVSFAGPKRVVPLPIDIADLPQSTSC